jgi:hypothetical protein
MNPTLGDRLARSQHLAQFCFANDWPQFDGNDHTGIEIAIPFDQGKLGVKAKGY